MLLQIKCSIQSQDSIAAECSFSDTSSELSINQWNHEADIFMTAEISSIQIFNFVCQKNSNISAAQHQNQTAELQKKLKMSVIIKQIN